MKWGHTFSVVGILLVFCGLAMALPMLVGLFYQDQSVIPLAKSMGITLLVGAMIYLAAPAKKQETLSHREGMAIVALGWGAVGVAGALPFYFSPSFMGFTDAVFESVSGFTTTGSSVLSDIEGVSKGILMWRSMIQWLGGMGIIVLSVAILPFLGVGGMQLYKAEVPTPVPDKLKPRIRDTAVILWQVYALFTVLEALLLFMGGMSVFDAVCHAFTTMPTGGFSTLNTSVGQYHSPYFEWVIIFFMIVAGINFSLHFQLLRGKPMALWKDPECRFFPGPCSGACRDNHPGHPRDGVQQPERVHTGLGLSGVLHHNHHRIRHGRLRAMAGPEPAHHYVLHGCGRLGRVHRRRHQVPQGNASF